ncbi:hypothetical protein QOZ80_8AG0633100 [Eleusine coracana subsp. coracana]|nr:hypothetical protein QOZ80_8AG0633100 [Eleusine coracana subsp. coracana]
MGDAAAPRPRSPPRYPDMCGRRRLQLEVQILNREVGFLEQEIQGLERIQPVSRCCKDVNEFVGAKIDPLMPVSKRKQGSCRLYWWIRSKLCTCFPCLCCSCLPKPETPSCSCRDALCCRPACSCLNTPSCCEDPCSLPSCDCQPQCGSCCSSGGADCPFSSCRGCCSCPPCTGCAGCLGALRRCLSCRWPSCCKCQSSCCKGEPSCCGRAKGACCSGAPAAPPCPECSCGCVCSCPRCKGGCRCPPCSGCLC